MKVLGAASWIADWIRQGLKFLAASGVDSLGVVDEEKGNTEDSGFKHASEWF